MSKSKSESDDYTDSDSDTNRPYVNETKLFEIDLELKNLILTVKDSLHNSIVLSGNSSDPRSQDSGLSDTYLRAVEQVYKKICEIIGNEAEPGQSHPINDATTTAAAFLAQFPEISRHSIQTLINWTERYMKEGSPNMGMIPCEHYIYTNLHVCPYVQKSVFSSSSCDD